MPFTIPWKGYEGLFFLEIKVSEMGVQDLIFGVVNMLHMLLSSALTLQKHVAVVRDGDECPCSTRKPESVRKRDTWAYSWTCVIMSPCCSLWPLRCQKHSGTETSRREKNWMAGCFPEMIEMIENHKLHEISHVFFIEEQNRFTARAETQFFTLESHACQSKWISILQTCFDKSHKYQHFVP